VNESKFKVRALTRTSERWDGDDGRFVVQGHAEIIQAGSPGGEAIAFVVMSPSQLDVELGGDPRSIQLGRGLLFMQDFDEPSVIAAIQRIVDAANADGWTELRRSVERYFDWVE
jgi:hypothetical protein